MVSISFAMYGTLCTCSCLFAMVFFYIWDILLQVAVFHLTEIISYKSLCKLEKSCESCLESNKKMKMVLKDTCEFILLSKYKHVSQIQHD